MVTKTRWNKGEQTIKRPRKIEQRPDTRKTTRRQYSDEEKRRAVAAALTANRDFPTGAQAHKAAMQALGDAIHVSTLHDWLKLYAVEILATLPSVATTTEIVKDTLSKWASLENKALDRLNEESVINDAQPRDLVIAAGTARDKLDRAKGVSADDMQQLDRLKHVCTVLNIDYKVTWTDYIDYLQSLVPTLQDKVRQSKALNSGSDADNGQS